MAKKLSKKLIKEHWEEYLGEYNQETILLYRELGDLIFLHHHSDLADSIATYGEDAINKINEEIIPTFKKNREAIRKLFNLLGENKNCKNWDLQKRYNFIATHQPPSEEEEIKSNITEAIENALRWDIGEHHLYSCIPLEDNRFNFEIGWLKDEDGEILGIHKYFGTTVEEFLKNEFGTNNKNDIITTIIYILTHWLNEYKISDIHSTTPSQEWIDLAIEFKCTKRTYIDKEFEDAE